MPRPRRTPRRGALELSPGENAGLCAGCVRCCTYVSIAIDAPRASWEYDQWIWALHHEHVSIYVERPEAWFVLFETRCAQLDPRGRCAIHGRHPRLCREYDPRDCERRQPLGGIRAWFRTGEQLEDWLARERPAHWARFLAWRGDRTPAAPPFIPLAALAPASAAVREGPLPLRDQEQRLERGEPVGIGRGEADRERVGFGGRGEER